MECILEFIPEVGTTLCPSGTMTVPHRRAAPMFLPGPWAHLQCQSSADAEPCSTRGKPEMHRVLQEGKQWQ